MIPLQEQGGFRLVRTYVSGYWNVVSHSTFLTKLSPCCPTSSNLVLHVQHGPFTSKKLSKPQHLSSWHRILFFLLAPALHLCCGSWAEFGPAPPLANMFPDCNQSCFLEVGQY